MSRVARLESAEIDAGLAALPEWTRDGDAIVRKVSLRTFREAQRLVNRVCDVAEGMDHHPDLHWVYVHVTFTLSTHDAGGLTAKDLRLAAVIDTVVADLG